MAALSSSCPSFSSTDGEEKNSAPSSIRDERRTRKFSDFVSLSVSKHLLQELRDLLLRKTRKIHEPKDSSISTVFSKLVHSIEPAENLFSKKDLKMAFSPDYPQIKKKRPSSPIDIVGVDAENLESKRTSYDINRESSITTIPPIKNEMKKMLPAVEEQPFSLCCPKNGPAPISASKGESLTKRSFTGAGDIKGQEPIFSKKETFQDAKQPKAKTPVHSASTSSMQVATSYFDPFETTTSSPMMSAPLSKATKRTEAAQPLRQPSAKAGVPAKEAIPYGTFGPMVLQSYYGVNHKFEGISPVDDYVFLDKVIHLSFASAP